MAAPGIPVEPPSGPDGEGVRVVRKPVPARSPRAPALALAALVMLALLVGAGWWWFTPRARPVPDAPVAAAPLPAQAPAAKPTAATAPARRAAPAARAPSPDDLPSHDPDDLASYFRPGDPEPTGAELISAMHDLGIRTGIGAFNPPGTSPPLEGLAVPEDYVLPEGYVRHHQVTDEGVLIEPILMFSPDFRLLDGDGRPVAMPEDRVVPPELAPPDLPVRRVRIPPAG